MEQKLLFFTFLGIFILTAGVALASLPGYIKIPESYRKKLFIMLLLEVTACIILLFKMNFLDNMPHEKAIVSQPENWIALNLESGRSEEIIVEIPGDTIFALGNKVPDDIADYSPLLFNIHKNGTGIDVFLPGDTGHHIGKIHQEAIVEAGFFNDLDIEDNIDDIAIIEFYPFEKTKNSKGLYQLNKFPDPIGLKVKHSVEGVFFEAFIDWPRGREWICKQEPVESRKPFLFKAGGSYYFISVVKADFSKITDKKYVCFMVARFSGSYL